VGDEGVDPGGVAGGQIQPDLGAAAVAQDVGGLVGDGGEQGGRVVAVDVKVLVGGGVVGDAARVAARVIGHHRIAVGEERGQPGEDAGVGGATGDRQ
jgi:hypothetical protein